jgi:hypothetical protein
VTEVYEAVFPEVATVTAITALASLVVGLTMLTVNPAFVSAYEALAVPSSL